MARILITSALPYINGVKHLGNLVGSQLPADVYARYMRARGHEVLLICATDEHGTPAELAAAEAGEPVADYCARLWQIQKRPRRRLPPELRPFRPLLQPAEPPPHPAFRRPPLRRRPDLRGDGEAGLLPRRRPLPARPLHRGHLPELRLPPRPRRPVRELHQAARPHRPHRPPLRHLRLHRPRGARDQASLSPPEPYARPAQGLDQHQDRLADPHHLDRPQMARRRRRPAGPRHHPRPRLGHPGPPRHRALARHGGQGLLRLVRRPHRIHRRHRRMGRRPPRRRRLGALVARGQGRARTSATSSSWARTTSPSTP